MAKPPFTDKIFHFRFTRGRVNIPKDSLFKVPDTIKISRTFQEFNEDKFTKRVIFNNDNSNAFVLNFLPEQRLSTHKHPGAEVYLFVVSENGTIIIDGKETKVTEKDVIHTSEEEQISFLNIISLKEEQRKLINALKNQ